MLNPADRAVQLGVSVDKGLGPQKVFPFMYSLVDSENDTWEENKVTDNLDSIGPLVVSGGTILHPVRMRPDYNFKMLWIKYSAYWFDSQNSEYLWYEPVTGWSGLLEAGDVQTQIGTPLVQSIRVSLSVHGPDGRYIYGGHNQDNAINNLGPLLPVQPTTIQGYDFGWGQIRTEYLVPKSGTLLFRFTNNHAIKDLRIAGLIYGMKIRV